MCSATHTHKMARTISISSFFFIIALYSFARFYISLIKKFIYTKKREEKSFQNQNTNTKAFLAIHALTLSFVFFFLLSARVRVYRLPSLTKYLIIYGCGTYTYTHTPNFWCSKWANFSFVHIESTEKWWAHSFVVFSDFQAHTYSYLLYYSLRWYVNSIEYHPGNLMGLDFSIISVCVCVCAFMNSYAQCQNMWQRKLKLNGKEREWECEWDWEWVNDRVNKRIGAFVSCLTPETERS